ncbi:MAG: cation:proton antiporter [bacterium]
MNIFLFLSIVFLLTFLLGRLIERIRVPWIFAALILGSLLAISNPFKDITQSETFVFLSQLGMYFLLFMIGFEVNLDKMIKSGGFIVRSTFFIILFEALFGTLLIHYAFDYSWFLSMVVAMSFATVGEAILIPILDEFKMVNTKLGQSIIGVGALDNIIELVMFIIVIFIIGSPIHGGLSIATIILSLLALFGLTVVFRKFKNQAQLFRFLPIEIIFLLALFILFFFIGISVNARVEPIAALLAGIAVKNFIPPKKLKNMEREIKSLAYGFFAPLFFLRVGSEIDMSYVIKFPLLILAVVLVSNAAKMLASYLVGRRELGTRQSILLGIGLSVRFSTSIIIIKLLYDSGTIDVGLYSVIVASSIIFKFVVPVLFSNLVIRWKVIKKI